MKGKKVMALGIGVTVLLGGCLNMNLSKDKEVKKEIVATSGERNAYEKDHFVRIQDYHGAGYTLRNSGKETRHLAASHREEIQKAVKAFFLDTYKTEVMVHNIIGAVDGASVFVESIGEPHFYTFAIVPIDLDSKKVKTDEVWSQEGQVENALSGALYAMAFDEDFTKLDRYLKETTASYPIVGTPIKAIEKVGAKGYATSHYYVNPVGDMFDSLYKMYLKNPDISKDELKDFLQKEAFGPEDIILTIYLYMKDKDKVPDKAIFNKIVSDIEQMEGIPRGSYSIILNDNLIDRRRAIGTKENSLKRTAPNEIMKD
ncbi:DUF1672 family protein [Peribacillus sp. NPDC097295]|uniref:DUF1672 family protein n=1 Tax=Peribacillus sp. NPDC097295 TaxID=3364402 RepID=UPI0038173606